MACGPAVGLLEPSASGWPSRGRDREIAIAGIGNREKNLARHAETPRFTEFCVKKERRFPTAARSGHFCFAQDEMHKKQAVGSCSVRGSGAWMSGNQRKSF